MRKLKVAFGELPHLLDEAEDIVRITINRKRDIAQFKKDMLIPFISFQVVVTARLICGEVGEYVYELGKTVEYDDSRMRILGEKSLELVETVKRKIEDSGKKVYPGQYTNQTILGVRP